VLSRLAGSYGIMLPLNTPPGSVITGVAVDGISSLR
jgi:hypothetical protein